MVVIRREYRPALSTRKAFTSGGVVVTLAAWLASYFPVELQPYALVAISAVLVFAGDVFKHWLWPKIVDWLYEDTMRVL